MSEVTDERQERVKSRVAENSPAIVVGVFPLSFGGEDAAQAAAREARTRGFIVDVTQQSEVRWANHARVRNPVAAADLNRYASRLKKVAATFDCAYHSFTPDEGGPG
jgi:Regulator of ribonuclease activity B